MGKSFAITDIEKQVDKFVLQQESKCKRIYKDGFSNVNKIKKSNAFDSIKLMECMIDYILIEANATKNPPMQKLLELRASYLEGNISEISKKFNLRFNEDKNIIVREEVLVSDTITFKANNKSEVELGVIRNIQDAKSACKSKGFNEFTSDSLERHLFNQCLESYGFASSNKTPASDLKVEKKQNDLKKQDAKTAQIQQKNTIERKTQLNKASTEKELEQKSIAPQIEVKEEQKTNAVEPSASSSNLKCYNDASNQRVCLFRK